MHSQNLDAAVESSNAPSSNILFCGISFRLSQKPSQLARE